MFEPELLEAEIPYELRVHRLRMTNGSRMLRKAIEAVRAGEDPHTSKELKWCQTGNPSGRGWGRLIDA